jgi:hypothetical protein
MSQFVSCWSSQRGEGGRQRAVISPWRNRSAAPQLLYIALGRQPPPRSPPRSRDMSSLGFFWFLISSCWFLLLIPLPSSFGFGCSDPGTSAARLSDRGDFRHLCSRRRTCLLSQVLGMFGIRIELRLCLESNRGRFLVRYKACSGFESSCTFVWNRIAVDWGTRRLIRGIVVANYFG